MLRRVQATNYPKEAKACLAYTMQPKRYETFIKALTGRWLPVYKDLAKDPLEHRHLSRVHKLAQTGPLISYSGPPHAGFGEATNTYVLPDMAARVLVENWEPENAAGEARKTLVAIWQSIRSGTASPVTRRTE